MATIDQLERQILQLQNELNERTAQMDALLRKSEQALDQSMHAYQLDGFGYLWAYDPETKTYHKTKMRVMSPELVDEAVKTRHLANGAVTGEKIATDAIDSSKIKDRTIEGRSIQTNAIGTEQLQDRSITGDEMKPNAVHNGKLADDAISTRNIQKGAVTGEKIAFGALGPQHFTPAGFRNTIEPYFMDLQHQIDAAMMHGGFVSNQFGGDDNISISQRTLTNAINAIWKTIRDMKGEVNDGITVTITPDWFISEDTAQVNISAKANDGVFEKLQIYINDEPVFEEPVENVQMIEHVATMSETSRVKTVAQILGMEYTDEQIVTKYYPFFMGSGQDWEDIVNEQYVRNLNNGKLRGGYNINIEHDGDYMFIIIPTSRQSEIVRFDMNGYEIPMEVINNQVYTIYKSANAYRKGLFQIDITTNCECEDCQ